MILDEFSAYTYFKRSQEVGSAYVEARLPFVTGINAFSLVKEFEAQIAARWDDYSLRGANAGVVFDGLPRPVETAERDFSSVDPTFALRWVPVSGVAVRASYGTGFMPPSLSQLVPNEPSMYNAAGLRIVDPKRGGEAVGDILMYGGGNPFLDPEKSESISAGIVLSGIILPGLRFSTDWVKIKKKDNIRLLSLSQSYVNDEDFIPGLLERAPDDGAGYGVGPIISYRSGYSNVAKHEVEAIDFSLEYSVESRSIGVFSFDLSATRNLKSVEQVTVSSTSVDGVGSSAFLKWKANSFVGWQAGDFSAGWATSYYDSSCASVCDLGGGVAIVNINVLFSVKTDSQIYHDFFIRKNFSLGVDGYLKVGVENFTNEIPPLAIAAYPYYSTYGDPRLRRYSLSFGVNF